MRTVRHVRSIPPERAWELLGRGEARLLDLRTELERRRYGWPPGVRRVSLARHIAWPGGPDTIYLCQHAYRSKLTARRGAAEIAGGWPHGDKPATDRTRRRKMTARFHRNEELLQRES